jgi:glycosyltransferase involved in cell wall biosynthesis
MHVIGQLVRGGAERQLIYTADALKAHGWSQVIVTFNTGDAWESVVEASGIPLWRVQPHPNKLWRLVQFYRLVQRWRPQIIHSWSRHTNVYTAGLGLTPNIKRVLAFRGNPLVNNNSGQAYQRVPFGFAYRWADVIVSNSQVALDQAAAAGLKMRQPRLIENIIVVQGRAQPGISAVAPHIVAAGYLVPLKAYDVLLQALGRLAQAGYTFELSLAGDGPERERLQTLADSLGIADRVHLLGEIDTVPDLFASAHLMVHPSLSEGLSNSILEAMAEGLPVIATRADGNLEIVSHEQNGLLVPPSDPAALAEAIERLLTDPDLRCRLGQNGLNMVRQRFGVDRAVRQHEDLYHSLIQS